MTENHQFLHFFRKKIFIKSLRRFQVFSGVEVAGTGLHGNIIGNFYNFDSGLYGCDPVNHTHQIAEQVQL
jgi:hypothetical protein